MAHLSKIFSSIPVDIPNRSGYDMSYENLFTMLTGKLVPVFCEEVIPNETYNVGHLTQVTLPPMATNFFGRVDFRLEAFFVPNRIIWNGWQNFFTMPVNNPFSTPVIRPTHTPQVVITSDCVSDLLKRGSLADYLGQKSSITACPIGGVNIPNILPFLAYHKIYDDWYRNKQIQQRCFVNNPATIQNGNVFALPWISSDWKCTVSGTPPSPSASIATHPQLLFPDKVNLFELRSRNWSKDYFTTAGLYPQASGDVVGSTVEFDTTADTGEISIPALRNANVLQRWLDRNNIAGEEYADQIKAHFGVLPSDAIMNRPIFLGSDVFGIYNRSVYQQGGDVQSDNVRNPFIGSVGSSGASSQGFKDGNLISDFRSTEHGYLMILASIVPHAYYGTGTRRYLSHSQRGDFAVPLLQGLGEQPIYNWELDGLLGSRENWKIFGYQQQYSEYKYHDDEIHGLLADGQNLESFALQRGFVTAPELGTEFLQIPENYMDQVQAVDTSVSGYNAWVDMYFNFKKVSPLSEYVIPTLGDLKNTHKEEIPYRGRML